MTAARKPKPIPASTTTSARPDAPWCDVAEAEGEERGAAHIKVGTEGCDTRRDVEGGFEPPMHHGETSDHRDRPHAEQHDQRQRAKNA